MALTRRQADADDLVQATCERALSRAHQWDPTTRADSWAFRIMQTVWLNELRSRKLREARAEEAARGSEETAELGEPAVEARLLLRQVETEIFALPEELRAVLVLACVEGLTYREVAEVLSIPMGTVMSRLARARLTLMRRIGADRAAETDNIVSLVAKCRD